MFLQEFSDKYTKGDAVTISDDNVEWKHDCDSLPKLLNKESEIYYFNSSNKTTLTTSKRKVKDHHDMFKFSAIC